MKKLISVTAAVLVLITTLAGCQSASPTAQPTATPAPAASTAAQATAAATAAAADSTNPWASLDLAKAAAVNFYVVGVQDPDWQKIVDQANALMQKKINTTVNFTHVDWADFQSKYALFLAADQDVDCIYGAAWCNYMDYVKQGAYKPLTMDFIQKNMPLTYKNQAPSSWKEATYKGSIYSIPNNRAAVSDTGAVTTQDLLDSVGMKASDITDWNGLNTYLEKIAAKKNSTGLYGINPQGSWPSDVYWFTQEHHLFDMDGGAATWMVWDYSAGKPFSTDDLNWYGESPAYLDFCLQMAKFNKAGVFPANVLQNQSFINDNFTAGKSAINFMTPSQANNAATQMKAAGKTLVYLDCCVDSQSKTRKGNYMGYGACFPVASTKTERAATALDCMKNDPEVNMLLLGGVEGQNYILDKSTNTYTLGPQAANYQWDNWFYLLESDSNPTLKMDDSYTTIQKHYESIQAPVDTFPVNGFNYDSSKYSAQLANISALINQYRFSFCFGVFQDDTQAKYNEFIQKCKAAGIDDVVADYRAQLKAFISGN